MKEELPDWHIDGRDIFIQEWHTLKELSVEEAESILNKYATLKALNAELLEVLNAVLEAARFALDFHAMATPEFVRRYGAGATTRDVADKLREALAAARYEEG